MCVYVYNCIYIYIDIHVWHLYWDVSSPKGGFDFRPTGLFVERLIPSGPRTNTGIK